MTTKVEKSIQVDAPVSAVYDQWTQFEEFPQFMGGVHEVTQLDDRRLHWVAEVAGVRREWDAAILEQVPNEKIAWAATEGATNAGAVYFASLGPGQTSVRLSLEYEPEGLVEQVGDKLNFIERRAEADLKKFKQFIEERGTATGGWRGSVNEGALAGTPSAAAAASTEGDSGKAGLSGKAVAAGAAVAAAGIAAAGALKSKSDSDAAERGVEEARAATPPVVPPPPAPGVVPPPPAPVVTDPVPPTGVGADVDPGREVPFTEPVYTPPHGDPLAADVVDDLEDRDRRRTT